MYSKIAIANMKKSLRDYTVYFLTLMLGVCIFYVFNSIEAQKAMLTIEGSGIDELQTIIILMDFVSVLVSVVLAFLIIYSNNFMIKRRKKELGVYMTLGMPARKVSVILVAETLLIGLLALAVGLALGIFASQGLAALTARLFDVRITDFHFIFSKSAFYKTMLYFGIIFIVVLLFNSFTVSKYKLIDLLYAGRKNEELKVRRPAVTIILLILAILLIAASYILVFRGGAAMIAFTFAPALAVNMAGTLFFFMALSGFLVKATRANKKAYYNGLNMFVACQLQSKINTNYFVMTFVCTMLFLTIVILSTVTSFNTVFNTGAQRFMPYDVSFTLYQQEENHTAIGDVFRQTGIDAQAFLGQEYEYALHETDVRMADIAEPNLEYLTDEAAAQYVRETTLDAISLYDYNRIIGMQGGEPIMLGQNEFAILSLSDNSYDGIRAYLADPEPVTINGEPFLPAAYDILEYALWTTYTGYGEMALVLPDGAAAAYPGYLNVYVANYVEENNDAEAQAHALADAAGAIIRQTSPDGAQANFQYATRIGVTQSNTGLTTALVFVGVYLGVIFLIAAAAILALQQLSEAADNKKRYDLLKKLGTEDKMINDAIRRQTGIYFFLPLVLAAVHSIAGIWVMNEGIVGFFGTQGLVGSYVVAAAFIALVYGGYYVATFLGCKNIVNAK